MVCHVIMDVTVVTEIEVFLSKKKAAPKEFEPGRPDHRSNAPPTDLWVGCCRYWDGSDFAASFERASENMHTVKFSDLKGVPVGCGSGLTENRVFCGHTLKKKANWLKFGRGAISRTRF